MNRRSFLGLLAAAGAAACTPALQSAAPAAPELARLGPAPELGSGDWLNSAPLRLADLKGKAAALLVFWTYT